jgi:hypothetical protein
MKVVHHDGPNGAPVTPTMPATGKFSMGVSPDMMGLDSQSYFNTCVRINILHPGNDASPYPIKALLTNLLKELQKKVHSSNVLLPTKPTTTHGALMLPSDIPSDAALVQKYFAGFQDVPGRNPKDNKTLCVFVRFRTVQSLRNLKFNIGFFQWLKDNRIFLRTHGFTPSYNVGLAGFISKMSPTLHRRDTVNNILQRALQQKNLDFEIHLVPNRIPIGTGDQKRYTTTVEIQVDCQHLYQAREVMIKVFELHKDDLPRDIYFVPSPANGTMAYDVYYQHLRLHHAHISNLRSFAISNVHDIKTEITVYGSDGISNPCKMPFETALLSQMRAGTTESLFYSIEPTQASTSEGRYLLVTHKDSIKEAELLETV